MINKKEKIYVAGHRGLVGSSVCRILTNNNYKNILTATSKQLDLRNQEQVENFIRNKKPKAIIIAAAKVGGIYANIKFQGEFIYDNLMIQNNLIHAAKKYNVKNLIFLGSSCIYPRMSKQPIKESYLLDGKLEKTNEA